MEHGAHLLALLVIAQLALLVHLHYLGHYCAHCVPQVLLLSLKVRKIVLNALQVHIQIQLVQYLH